jgi:signal transduction histidine kinase
VRLAHGETPWTIAGGTTSGEPRQRRGGRVWSSLSALERRRGFWVVLWTLGAAAQVAALWPLVVGDGPATWSLVAYRVTGGSFVAAGLIAWRRRPENRVGALMVATGFLFFTEQLPADVDASLPQTLAMLFSGYWMIPFAVLLLVFPQGRWISGRLEQLVIAAVAFHLLLQPAWLLVLEQPGVANDLGFWPNDRAEDWIDKAQRGSLLVGAATLCVVIGWRWWHASPPLRRVLVPVLVGGASMLSLAGMLTVDLINGTRSQTQLNITLLALAVVPLAFLGGLLRSRLARVAIADLVIGLRDNPSPVELEQALARAVGDPALELVYWLPELGSYVDVGGREVELPGPDSGRATTPIDRDGVRVAAIVHDPSLNSEPELLGAVTAAASIALENSRLSVELHARLDDLRASRTRVVEAAQSERQRLERNLHDGAQQRLVAMSLELTLLEQRFAHDVEAQRAVDQVRHELSESLAELRELARGIHPAVVTGHGLAVALESVAARSPVPVRLDVRLDERVPEAVEIAAYYLVTESLTNVIKYAEASAASVMVSRRDGELVVEVVDDGVGGADEEAGSGLRGLADRVEALDGRLRVWSPRGGGTRVRAEIPCAS